MISVNTLQGTPFVINAFLIQKVESFPDTTITLTNGEKYIVKNTVKEVINKSIDFFKEIYQIDYKSQLLESTIEGENG